MRPDDFSIDNCLKCSVCNAACPVYTVHPQYPGPKHLGPELERLRLEGLPADTPWIEYCLGCHRCDLACPHQVEVSEMIARAKAQHRKPIVRALRDWWFARPGLLGKLTTILPAVSNFFLRLRPMRFLMSRLMQITARRVFPAYTRPVLQTRSSAAAEKVLFFPGCFLTYNRPDLGFKIIELLAHNGIAAEVAETGCCGVPASANGDAAQARAMARKNLEAMAGKVAAGMKVVTACASCGYQLKSAFGGIFAEDGTLTLAARQLAAQSWDLAELLDARAAEGKLNTAFHALDCHVAYHAPCHLNSQGIGRPWVHLLRQIPGVQVDDVNAGCCGMSGTYGFKEEKYGVSVAIGQRLFDGLDAIQPQVVATECATCQMQIEHGTAFKTVHPVEILLEAYEGKAN
jgi:glycerol-3-phosphate dehydrogenase subunit C